GAEVEKGDELEGVEVDARDVASPPASNWFLQGKEIAVVSSYKYLGLKITDTLDYEAMVMDRVAIARKTLGMLKRFLVNCAVPSSIRVRVLKTMLLPVCTYGSEVWGGVREWDKKMQGVVNDAMHCIVQGWSRRTLSSMALAMELDIPPIHAICLQNRLKGWVQGKRTSCVLRDLLETRESLTGTKQTFLIVTERMGSSYLNTEEAQQAARETGGETGGTGGETGKTGKTGKSGKKRYNWAYFRKNFHLDDARGVLVNAWEKMVRESGTVGNEQLVLQGRVWNRSYMDSWFEHPEVGRGFAVIMQMRVGAWDSGERIRKKKLTCPCCANPDQETLWHYVVECSRWVKEREEMVRVYLGSGEDATAQVDVDQDTLTKMLEKVIGIMDWRAVSQNTPEAVIDRQIPAPMLVKSVHAKRCNQGLTMVIRCTKAVTFDVRAGEGGKEVRERDERMRAAFALATFLNATLNPRKQLVAMWSGNETIITKYNNQKK
ncbi:hypothetical protein, partial [Methanomethylophilus alvi]|uniref:hypothetical protein n=1 Tax=Methanomethylophilus alvi TaxID=1291540 RepID=UPI0037DC9E62